MMDVSGIEYFYGTIKSTTFLDINDDWKEWEF